MIDIYVSILGAAMVALGTAEFAGPRRAFTLWRRWAAHRLFFLHGALLIGTGFPLLLYHGSLSTPIFIIGVVIVLTGPFILIYPEKFRAMFNSIEEEMGAERVPALMRMESIIRIALGAVLLAGSLLG
ncbi:MAG: hypothetical protein JW838_05240 [Spirochaetes bacterium]|nr:hypothetical protein [Spirochaetota bacterium]